MSDVTRILEAAQAGDPKAAAELLPVVYEELRKLAAAKLAQEQSGQTLQPTALVHEAWLRLVGTEEVRFSGRGHFFAAAAEAMRRILIDRARQRNSLKRGAGAQQVDLEELEIAVQADDDTLLEVNAALEKLAKEDPDSANFIEPRFFAGLTNLEAAQVLGIPERTARRHWSFARAWPPVPGASELEPKGVTIRRRGYNRSLACKAKPRQWENMQASWLPVVLRVHITASALVIVPHVE